MRVLCDTNLLVRAVSQDDPDHSTALDAIAQLKVSNRTPVLVPQYLYEFYAVATRPAATNGIGVTPHKAIGLIDDFIGLMPLLRDERTVFDHWLSLMTDHEVEGKQTHDARLVAAMDRHGVKHLMTFNAKHFQRYTHLTVWSPQDILSES